MPPREAQVRSLAERLAPFRRTISPARPREHFRTLAHAAVASLGQRLIPRLRIPLSRYLRKGVVLAVGIRIKLPGVTQEQFDAAHDHINPDRSPWPGLLFHSSGPIDG